jgi:hypothetical protein
MVREFGNQWAYIATVVIGRTPNDISNRWNSSLKKRNIQVDPGFVDRHIMNGHDVWPPPPMPMIPGFGGGDAKGGDEPQLPGSGQESLNGELSLTSLSQPQSRFLDTLRRNRVR